MSGFIILTFDELDQLERLKGAIPVKLYLRLKLHAMGRESCWPSVGLLAEKLGAERTSIQKDLKPLRAAGLVCTEDDPSNGCGRRFIIPANLSGPSVTDPEADSLRAESIRPPSGGIDSAGGGGIGSETLRAESIRPEVLVGLKSSKPEKVESVSEKPVVMPQAKTQSTDLTSISSSPEAKDPDTKATGWPEGFARRWLIGCGHVGLESLGEQIEAGSLGYHEDRMLAIIAIRNGKLRRLKSFAGFVASLGDRNALQPDLRSFAKAILARKQKPRSQPAEEAEDEAQPDEPSVTMGSVEELGAADREAIESLASRVARDNGRAKPTDDDRVNALIRCTRKYKMSPVEVLADVERREAEQEEAARLARELREALERERR